MRFSLKTRSRRVTGPDNQLSTRADVAARTVRPVRSLVAGITGQKQEHPVGAEHEEQVYPTTRELQWKTGCKYGS
jgi:hypothetical protein